MDSLFDAAHGNIRTATKVGGELLVFVLHVFAERFTSHRLAGSIQRLFQILISAG